MENAWSTMPDRIPGLLKQWGQYSRSTEQDDPWSMVAFGDRKDFLQVLRMVHFLRKCTMRKTCKRDAAEALPLPHGSQRRSVCSNEPGGCARLASAMGNTANAQHRAGMAITQLMPRAGMRRPIAAGIIIEVALVLMIRILLTGPMACTKRREVMAIIPGSSGP